MQVAKLTVLQLKQFLQWQNVSGTSNLKKDALVQRVKQYVADNLEKFQKQPQKADGSSQQTRKPVAVDVPRSTPHKQVDESFDSDLPTPIKRAPESPPAHENASKRMKLAEQHFGLQDDDDDDFLDSAPSTKPSQFTSKPALGDARPTCKYGMDCFRKNPQHFEEFKHPPEHPMSNQKLS